MVALIIVGLTLIAVSILCFDLLELAIRRVLLVLALIIAAWILGFVYFCIGLYQGLTRDKTLAKQQAASINRVGSQLWSAYCKAWVIPAKVLMLEPHIKKAVSSGVKDGLAFQRWTKRTQLNPNHQFTVLHPARSFGRALPYLMHKYSMMGQGKKPLKPSQINSIFDILP